MFNKTIVNHEEKVVAVTQVVEKSISPDKVTDMYDKVREQVEKDIIRTIILKDNELNGVVMEVRDEFRTFQKKILYRFTINGKEYLDTEFEVERNDTDWQLAVKLYEKIKNKISDKIVKDNVYIFANKHK